jgi:hypothetical protein
MQNCLTAEKRRRLDIQGFDSVSDRELLEAGNWLRLAFGLCSLLAIIGTVLTSTPLLLVLLVIAALAAAFPVHPFDLIYNLGIRHVRKTGPLPKRGPPVRFACGLGTVWLAATIWAFQGGNLTLGYVLGGALAGVGLLVSTTDICIPSMIYQAVFGRKRNAGP